MPKIGLYQFLILMCSVLELKNQNSGNGTNLKYVTYTESVFFTVEVVCLKTFVQGYFNV